MANTTIRRILLHTQCSRGGGGGCCGNTGNRSRYAILTIEGSNDDGWTLIDNTKSTSNIMDLSKKNKDLWKGTVYNMDLHKDPDFMAQVLACEGVMGEHCEVISS